MTLKETVDEWFEVGKDDIEVAELCFKGKKYLYCAYMCQQGVEKAFKGCIQALGNMPPRIHDLYDLAKDADVWELLETEQILFLRNLNVYAIEPRYPERKRKLLAQCTRSEAAQILQSSKEVVGWLRIVAHSRLEQEAGSPGENGQPPAKP